MSNYQLSFHPDRCDNLKSWAPSAGFVWGYVRDLIYITFILVVVPIILKLSAISTVIHTVLTIFLADSLTPVTKDECRLRIVKKSYILFTASMSDALHRQLWLPSRSMKRVVVFNFDSIIELVLFVATATPHSVKLFYIAAPTSGFGTKTYINGRARDTCI